MRDPLIFAAIFAALFITNFNAGAGILNTDSDPVLCINV